MLELRIKKANNGFILEWEEDWSSEGVQDVRVERDVIEGGGDFGDEREAMTRLLERVSDFFGLGYDKYGKENLRILWDGKGHKIE